jgi:competence protein ComEC
MRAAVLGFAAGVLYLQRQAELPSGWLLGALVLGALAAWAAARRMSTLPAPPGLSIVLRAAVGAAVGALIGFTWAGMAAHARLADALDPLREGRDVEVTGVVASLPQPLDRGVRFEFDIESHEPAARVPQRVLLAWYNGLGVEEFQEVAPLRAGERWRFTVRLRRPHGLSNPHGFDYEAWLLARGIRATGYVRPRGAARIEALVERPGYLLERLRERLRERFWDALPDAPHAGVLIALAIGEQRAIDSSQWQLFARTGVSHLMSISGLHVTMVAGLGAWFVLLLWRRSARLALRLPAQKAAAAAGFLTALAYCLLSGFAVPAQRTLYMVGIVALALWLDRASIPSRVLALALAVVLLLDPWAVLEAGFWLSFCAVALIFYTGTARPASPGWLFQWGSVQWAMTLGLAPLTLVLFGQVSLVSPLANAVAIPLVSFVITPLALAGTVLPLDFPLHAAHFLMELMMPLLERLASLEGAVWRQHAPVAWTLPLASVGVLWLLAPRGVPARSMGLVLMVPLFFVEPARLEEGAARVAFLDVGQGMAVAVRTRNHALLYDAGPAWGADRESGADSGARVVVPYLLGEGVNRLDAMVISHEDSDHSGGAASVLAAVPAALLISSLATLHPVQSMVPVRVPCYAGRHWTWDGVRFTFLHPTRAEYANPWTVLNDRSCVLRIEAAGGSVLLAGDVGRFAERDILRREKGLRSDVLLVPHHGSATSSTQAFVDAVAPRYAVFSMGYRNRFGHPRADVVERYRLAGSELVRSDTAGAFTVGLGRDAASADRHRETARRYWDGR